MKVLHVIKTTDGADWAWKMVGHLVKRGVEVHVALPVLHGRFIEDWRATGAVLHELDLSLPLRTPWKWWRQKAALKKLLADISPDIIHAHFVTNILFLRMILGDLGPRRLFQVPGPLHLEHKLFATVERVLATSRDLWIASSRYIRDIYLAQGVDRERVFLSYYGSDPEGFSDQRSGDFRRELSIPSNAFVVGNVNYFYAPKKYLGQERGLKNHEDILAAAKIGESKGAIFWVMVGQQWGKVQDYFIEMKHLAQNLNASVLMPGWRSREAVKKLWADFDLAVHVPLSENCGGVIEPLMAGVPVVASAVGGLPEVIIPGVTGDLIPEKDPQALAQAVARVKLDPIKAKKQALRGQKLVREMFDSARTSREIFEIYHFVLGLGPRPLEYDSRDTARLATEDE